MRIGRKILYSLCFFMTLFAGSRMKPVLAADYTYTDDKGVTYEYTDTGVLRSVTGDVRSVDLAKMAKEKNLTIWCIGEGAFSYNSYITSVNIPASVEMIGNSAFWMCSALSEVTYEEGSKLTSIGESAFWNNNTLMDFHQQGTEKDGMFHLPEGVSVIGESAFCGTKLTGIVMPEKLTRMEAGVFADCENLSEVILSENITAIGKDAFIRTNLSSIKIPDKVTVIGEGAFRYVSTLREVTFPTETSFTIEKEAFMYAGFTEITLPVNCTKVGTDAFAADYDSELSVVKIENASMIIGKNAFPDTVALYGKEGSTAQQYAKDNSLLFSQLAEDNSGKEEDNKGGEQTPSSDDGKTEEDNTKPDTPSDDTGNTKPDTPSDDTGNTKPDTPSDNTNNTQPGTTPDNTNTTQSDKTPGSSVQTDKQPSDTSAQPTQPSIKLKVGKKYTVQSLIYKAVSESSVVFVKPKKKTITKLTVPDFVTIEGCQVPVIGVAAKACYKFKKLKKVTIGNNVSTIGAQAFQECKKLKEVTLGKELTQIGTKCFYKDSKLKKLVIKSKKLKKIGKKSIRGTPKKKYHVPKGYKIKYKRLLKKGK